MPSAWAVYALVLSTLGVPVGAVPGECVEDGLVAGDAGRVRRAPGEGGAATEYHVVGAAWVDEPER